METNRKCYQWASSQEGDVFFSRSIFFERDGKKYRIRVATPDLIADIKRGNKSYADPAEMIDEAILPMDDISDLDKICEYLHTAPLKSLAPYIEERDTE